MVTWYIKEFAKLTGVSVRTLHHYDKIDLLKPSIRQENNYRLYSEGDLLKQQQIIALKFFGFELSQIKNLLFGNLDVNQHLMLQSRFLEEKASALLEANQLLKDVILDESENKSIHWKTIIKLIEVYRMTKELEQTWVGKSLNGDELKEYAQLEQSLKARSNEKESFEKNWAKLVKQISDNLTKDPSSDIGNDIAKQCNSMVNRLYGRKFAGLKKAVWEKGFKGEHGSDNNHGLSVEMVSWLDRAMDAYWRECLYNILSGVGIDSDSEILSKWNEALDEMYGDEQSLKDELVTVALEDEKITLKQKEFLKGISS